MAKNPYTDKLELKKGDEVIYHFPDPKNAGAESITGLVDYVGDNYIFLNCENNINLKISFKNFHLIRLANKDKNVLN